MMKIFTDFYFSNKHFGWTCPSLLWLLVSVPTMCSILHSGGQFSEFYVSYPSNISILQNGTLLLNKIHFKYYIDYVLRLTLCCQAPVAIYLASQIGLESKKDLPYLPTLPSYFLRSGSIRGWRGEASRKLISQMTETGWAGGALVHGAAGDGFRRPGS